MNHRRLAWRPIVPCAALLAISLLAAPSAVAMVPTNAQVGGNLAKYPPRDLTLEIQKGESGRPELSQASFELVTGGYYRITVSCPDVEDDLDGWRIELPELLRNVHLRLVSVGDVEIHMQGLFFHAIECDEAAAARFSFVPIRPGTYELSVSKVPSAVGRPIGEAGAQQQSEVAVAEVRVR